MHAAILALALLAPPTRNCSIDGGIWKHFIPYTCEDVTGICKEYDYIVCGFLKDASTEEYCKGKDVCEGTCDAVAETLLPQPDGSCVVGCTSSYSGICS